MMGVNQKKPPVPGWKKRGADDAAQLGCKFTVFFQVRPWDWCPCIILMPSRCVVFFCVSVKHRDGCGVRSIGVSWYGKGCKFQVRFLQNWVEYIEYIYIQDIFDYIILWAYELANSQLSNSTRSPLPTKQVATFSQGRRRNHHWIMKTHPWTIVQGWTCMCTLNYETTMMQSYCTECNSHRWKVVKEVKPIRVVNPNR